MAVQSQNSSFLGFSYSLILLFPFSRIIAVWPTAAERKFYVFLLLLLLLILLLLTRDPIERLQPPEVDGSHYYTHKANRIRASNI